MEKFGFYTALCEQFVYYYYDIIRIRGWIWLLKIRYRYTVLTCEFKKCDFIYMQSNSLEQ
jgi:hypothetical protein